MAQRNICSFVLKQEELAGIFKLSEAKIIDIKFDPIHQDAEVFVEHPALTKTFPGCPVERRYFYDLQIMIQKHRLTNKIKTPKELPQIKKPKLKTRTAGHSQLVFDFLEKTKEERK